MRCWTWLVIALLSSFSFAADQTADAQAILGLHSTAREAHLKGDANLLAQTVADEFLDVGRGKFDRVKREDFRQRFTKFFGTTKYSRWDDVVPPLVYVAPGGKSGWMAVQLHAEVTLHEEGKPPTDTAFDMAWLANYEKRDGKWIMVAISYNVPSGK
jgi:hypothetical protein